MKQFPQRHLFSVWSRMLEGQKLKCDKCHKLKMRDSKRKVVIKVFKALEGAGGWIWVRELARRTKLHPEQVRRVLDDELREAVEEMC